MRCIPITQQLADVVGDFGEKIENRSLLLEKFPIPKTWYDQDGSKREETNATRWSLLRVVSCGSQLLKDDAADFRRRASGNNTDERNRTLFNSKAELCCKLANTNVESPDSQKLRMEHSCQLLSLIRQSYDENNHSIITAKLEGRLAINLSDSLLQNAGIALDRLFGIPYIPGSAAKGIARHMALEALLVAPETEIARLLKDFCLVFGTSSNDFEGKGDLAVFTNQMNSLNLELDRKGAVSFLPAYPVNEAKLVVDLTTVHYPDYYRSGTIADLKMEKPLPNPFPTVERGAIFAFPMVMNGNSGQYDLLKSATYWLESALEEKGVGAKTAAGYGWFSLCPEVLQNIVADESQRLKQKRDKDERLKQIELKKMAEKEAMAKLNPIDRTMVELNTLDNESFVDRVKKIDSLPEIEKRAIIQLFIDDPEMKKKLKIWRKKKPQNVQLLVDTAKSLKIDLS